MLVPPLDDHGHTCCFSLTRFFTSSSPTPNQTCSTSNDVVDRSVKRVDSNVKDIIVCPVVFELQCLLIMLLPRRQVGYDDIPISFESCCDFSSSPTRHSLDPPPTYFGTLPRFDPEYDFMTTIVTTIDAIDSALRSLSLSIHGR